MFNKKAEVDFKAYILSFLGGAMFLLCMYLFAINVGDNPAYNIDFTIDDSQIDISSLQSELDASNDTSKEYLGSFTNASVIETDDDLSLRGTWGVMKDSWDNVFVIFKIFLGGSSSILGIYDWVLGTLILMLTILLLFAAWKTIKTGK